MNTPSGFETANGVRTEIADDALCFVWRGDRILARAAEPPALPAWADLRAFSIDGLRFFFGTLRGRACVAIRVADDVPEPPGWQWRGLRSLFLQISDEELALAGRASQIVEWDRTHRFCGRCATPTIDKNGERCKECPACGLTSYPRISPAMMVLVTRGKDLLLARANRFPAGTFSALAGFVEAGESIEDCIHREVREEVGVDVQNLEYFASQSWPFPHSLMIAFTAEYAGGEMRPCDDEIAEARWFALDALPPLPGPVSISRQLINATIEKLRSR